MKAKILVLVTFVTSTILISCGQPSENAAEPPAVQKEKVMMGYQLYTLRGDYENAKELKSTLGKAKEIGYDYVETFGYMNGSFWGLTPTELKSSLDSMGIKTISGHYLPAELMGSDVKPIDVASIGTFLDAAEQLGQHYVIIPWMSESWRTMAGYKHLIDYLRELSRQANERGLEAGWHNHDFEFQSIDPSMPNMQNGYEFIIQSLEGSGAVFEMDLNWVAMAGENPVDWFHRFPGKFPLWHVKDYDPVNEIQVPVGQGMIPWEEIFGMADVSGMKAFFVEQDECHLESGLNCINDSYTWLVEKNLFEL
jgi:sugar phosphate isomerase/epimerase